MNPRLFFIHSLSVLFSFPGLGDAIREGPIICTGDLPPGEYGDPEYYSPLKTAADFPGGINQFCAKKRGDLNMGAYCDYNFDPPRVEIDYGFIDMSLYNPVTYKWCLEHCQCVSPADDRPLSEIYAFDRVSVSDSVDSLTWQQGAASSSSSSCQANAQCVPPRRCVLRPQRNILRLGQSGRTVYTSRCASVYRRPPLGGRDETSARQTAASYTCACNATYVSSACCESATGVVHKDDRNELGSVLLV